MNINRHNYEEFFLLYVDDELSPQERSAVETFIQQNSDLAAELEMLLQAGLQEDNLHLNIRTFLYNQSEGITADNYEEYFLLSVDDELTGKESDEVEKFVLQHPELQGEYLLLKKAKLEPEQIVFQGKKQLYKTGAKERLFLLSPWFKISAAAALVGLACMTWIFTNNADRNVQPVVSAPMPKIIEAVPSRPSQPIPVPVTKVPPDSQARTGLSNAPVAIAKVAKRHKQKSRPSDVAVNGSINKTMGPVVSAAHPAAMPENLGIKTRPADEPVATITSGNKNNLPVRGEVEKVSTVAGNQNADYSASLAKHVVYREIDSQDEDEEKSFYIGSAEINKNKLKGFLKKAAGIFGKRQDSDGEHSLKIAGFEIKSN